MLQISANKQKTRWVDLCLFLGSLQVGEHTSHLDRAETMLTTHMLEVSQELSFTLLKWFLSWTLQQMQLVDEETQPAVDFR